MNETLGETVLRAKPCSCGIRNKADEDVKGLVFFPSSKKLGGF